MEVAFSARHPDVQPIAGEDYGVLDPPPAHEHRRWWISDASPGSSYDADVHRLDCTQGALSQKLATDREALRVPADPEEAVTCSVCRPEAVLGRLFDLPRPGSRREINRCKVPPRRGLREHPVVLSRSDGGHLGTPSSVAPGARYSRARRMQACAPSVKCASGLVAR